MEKGTLYMLPSPISGDSEDVWSTIPAANRRVMEALDYFIVENVRTARRFLSAAGIAPGNAEFAELNEHTRPEELHNLIAPLCAGRSAGVISEAGVPGIADPGAEAALLCHRRGIAVKPLAGPSSILLALMASGLNGQSFAFNGYLPIKEPARTGSIRALEKRAKSERQSQIFIETPYRNSRLFEQLLAVCHPATLLTVAVDITGPAEHIRTLSIGDWHTAEPPFPTGKIPAVFIIL